MPQYISRYLSQITNLRTGAQYSCLDYGGAAIQDLKGAFKFRTPAEDAIDAPGGVMASIRSLPSMRTFSATIRKKYGGSVGTYIDAWNEIFAVCGLGDDMRFLVIEPDGSSHYFFGRVDQLDFSAGTSNYAFAELPITFICPSPFWRSIAKPGTLLADSGLIADSGLHADADPDNFTVGSGFTFHTLTNTGSIVADTGPTVYMTGPQTGFCIVWNNSLPLINGQHWFVYYGRSIAAGETIKIDAGAGDVTSNLSSTDAYSGFQYGTGQEYWFMVDKNNNSIQVANGGASTGARVRIDYRAIGG
jgi:hypothetical protein